MPPSTRAERAAAIRRLAELHAEVERESKALRLRRAKMTEEMVRTLGMSRREIGVGIGVSHNAIRGWLEEVEDGTGE